MNKKHDSPLIERLKIIVHEETNMALAEIDFFYKVKIDPKHIKTDASYFIDKDAKVIYGFKDKLDAKVQPKQE